MRQETNTFIPIIAEKSAFSSNNIFEGEEIFQDRLSTRTAICGAVAACREVDATVIPAAFVSATAASGGRVADDVLEGVMERAQW